MEITRPFPWKGRVFSVGQSFDFPEASCERMERANPPFGRRIDQILGGEPDNGQFALHMFTIAALKSLKEYDLTFDEYEGDASGSGGRVTKSDVASWLKTENQED